MSSGDSLVFLGGGPVAEASLASLQKHFPVESVVTKPTTYKSISRVTSAPVHQVTNKHDLSDLISEKQFSSKLGVIVDFGIIVEQAVIDYFPFGIVNSHFSLLPRWRGADPISFAVLHGDSKTGVSLMLIDSGLDTGKLIRQKSIPLDTKITTPELTKQLVAMSNQLLTDTLPRYIRGEITPRKQPHTDRATYSRKLTKQDGLIDWSKTATKLDREIRAFAGWPGSRTVLADKDVTITKAHIVKQSGPSGQFNVGKRSLTVYCGKDALEIDELRPAGKNTMPITAFLAGYRDRL